jgi:2'-5' RNA ligase
MYNKIMPDSKRLFIAIEIPASVQQSIGALSATLHKVDDYGLSWVKSENIHLTLKFLGDTPVSSIGKIEEGITHAAASFAPFEITLSGSGCFPSPAQPRVLWVGLQADDRLGQLQRAIDDALANAGFAREKKPFSGHLTLARVSERCPIAVSKNIYAHLMTLPTENLGTFSATEITLFQSVLSHSGAQYTPLFRCGLKKQI